MDVSQRRSRNRRQANGSSESMAMMHKNRRSAQRLAFAGEKLDGKELSSLEDDFIYAAEFGDIPTVQRILDENPHFNVDFSDILGRTPLRLAVGNEHLEVVEYLLDRSHLDNIYEALLQAIGSGHEQIAESILKHPKYQGMKKEKKHFGETDHFFNTASEDSPFSPDITPLILAAERNQIEIVQLLLLRGEKIRKPHHYYCSCQECSNKLEYDQLRLAKTRLNAYKGQSSGAYISLSSKDPILTAFELARELRAVARVEKYYKTEYLELADQLSAYVVKLLDKVRGHDELEIVINKTGRDSELETYERLSRFKLAIRYNEKKFVAHPSCQQKLVSIWYSDLRALERSNWFYRAVLVSLVALFYPIMCILYLIAPKSRVGEFLRYPCIKFIGHTMSFIGFLTMLLTSSAMESPAAAENMSFFKPHYAYYTKFRQEAVVKELETSILPTDFRIRAFQPQVINLILSLWILGMLWQKVKQVYNDGVQGHFDSLYNYFDFAVLTVYITSFTLRFLTLIKVNQALTYFEKESNWISLKNGSMQSQEQFYWLIADRLFWDSRDPHILAEGMFAMANVISFTRISYLLPANELFGPMQISLAKMISDILKFGAVFMVVFCAFMVGLHNLYWYYPKDVRKQVEIMDNNITTHAEKHFGIPHLTILTVFWSLFGRGEMTVVELGEFNHFFTETLGYWMFGVYNIATVTVLLNMLIAMMSRSFEIIQGEADTEWKFARSKLYMEYIQDDTTLPIPFNIVPSPKSAYYMLRYCFRRCCGEDDDDTLPARVDASSTAPENQFGGRNLQVPPHNRPTPQQERANRRFQINQTQLQTNGFIMSESDPNSLTEKLTYQKVMKRIVKRYIFDVQRENDANDGDFDEIKQDISSFRYEMLNHVSVRQMETMETKERLDRLYGKLDSIVMHQKQLVRMVSSGLSVPDDAIQPLKDLFSTSTESFRSSIGMDSFNREDIDDDDAIADGITFTVKATNKSASDDQSKLGIDSKMNTPKRVATLRNNNTQRQNAEDNTSEREMLTNDVDLEDIKTQFSVSKECG